jgi:hypothetical protein
MQDTHQKEKRIIIRELHGAHTIHNITSERDIIIISYARALFMDYAIIVPLRCLRHRSPK